jgi:hypothetical protein
MGLTIKDIKSGLLNSGVAKAASVQKVAEAKAASAVKNARVDNGFRAIELLTKAAPALTDGIVKVQSAMDTSRKVACSCWIEGQKLLSESTRNKLAERGQQAAIDATARVYGTLENTVSAFIAVELLNRTAVAERRATLIEQGKFDDQISVEGVVYYKETYTSADEAPTEATEAPAEDIAEAVAEDIAEAVAEAPSEAPAEAVKATAAEEVTPDDASICASFSKEQLAYMEANHPEAHELILKTEYFG